MILNPEPERLTRAVFKAANAALAETFFATEPTMIRTYQMETVRCLDCGRCWSDDQLKAQACPVCDGRVKDMA